MQSSASPFSLEVNGRKEAEVNLVVHSSAEALKVQSLEHWESPQTLSGAHQGHKYFHNNAEMVSASFYCVAICSRGANPKVGEAALCPSKHQGRDENLYHWS